MKLGRWIEVAVVLLIAAAGIGGIYWFANQPQGDAPSPSIVVEPEPEVGVLVAPLRIQSIEEPLIAYGTVVSALGRSKTIDEPFEVRVRQVFVTAGESVDTGTRLIEIEPSADTRLKLDQARSELKAAQELERLTSESVNMKLATRQSLSDAELRLKDAQAALQSMLDRGMAEPRVIKSEAPGMVMQINAQAGQIVAAGSPLLEITDQNQIEVRIGVESEDIGNLHVGQPVRVIPIHQGEDQVVDAKVEMIAHQVNPQTRLIDVYVAPASTAHLMLNEYVRGEIIVAADRSLVAPRSAVLPEEDHYVVFTVEHDRAVKHEVQVGIENNEQIQILGTDLQSGQLVVVNGNSELKHGMAVKPEPAP